MYLSVRNFLGQIWGTMKKTITASNLLWISSAFICGRQNSKKKLPSKTNVFENVIDTISHIMNVSASMNASLNNSPLFRHHRLDEPP